MSDHRWTWKTYLRFTLLLLVNLPRIVWKLMSIGEIYFELFLAWAWCRVMHGPDCWREL